MKAGCIPHGLALAAALALSSSGAFGARNELRPLSESEMSAVYGRGLGDPALGVLGALTTQEQSGSGVTASALADATSALGAMASDGAQGIDRRMAQQNLQATANGVQATVKAAQTLAALGSAQAIIASTVALPGLPLSALSALPALPALASLDAIQKKH